MAKVIIDVPNTELADLLRLPEVVKLLDAGRVSVQPDHPQLQSAVSPAKPQQTEPSTRQEGRETFERRASERGFKIRPSGQSGVGDFVVDGRAGSRPVRLVCSESPRISLRTEWGEPANLTLAYIWLLPNSNRIFLMSYMDAAHVLGEKALESPSFTKRGYYTTAINPGRQRLMERFEDRWDVFNS
jgi:hypothetical protein